MKYNDYIKDLQVEISNDSSLFPTKKYFLEISKLSEIKSHAIKNGFVYVLVSENLEFFKLIDNETFTIVNREEFVPINKAMFSLLHLPYYAIKSGIKKYTDARKELYRISQVHPRLLNFTDDVLKNIALFHILEMINTKEQINQEKQQLRPMIKNFDWNRIGIKCISPENDDDDIEWEKNWDNLIIVEFDSDYELKNLYIISKEVYFDKYEKDLENDECYVGRSIMDYGLKYNKNDFTDLDDKYLKMFGA
jgi:hypothetical protein